MLRMSLIFLSFTIAFNALAECLIENAEQAKDPLYLILRPQERCPTQVGELLHALRQETLSVTPAMVANRGRHNPALGSFSFFEEVIGQGLHLARPIERGEFFFGHFTGLNHEILELDQMPNESGEQKLLIEAIAWDQNKGMYNFYELIAQTGKIQWFYRGDSQTALDDNRYLFLNPPPGKKKFGSGMRCSACHVSGGPIMKELAAPHNDWWTTARPLPLGNNKPSPAVANYLSRIMDASTFSQSIEIGINRLEASESYQQAKTARSLREQLRPVFCTTEINIASDLKESSSANDQIIIPSAYFLSPWLGSAPLRLAKRLYVEQLEQNQMQFPETNQKDADHAWLSLVKSHTDNIAIRSLISQNLISEAWVKALMAVDLNNPTLSLGRCQLLKLLPENYSSDWQELFLNNLKASSLPFASELWQNLSTPMDYEGLVSTYVDKISDLLGTNTGANHLFTKLIQDRKLINRTDLVKNKLGQILEPGFRVIFPESRDTKL